MGSHLAPKDAVKKKFWVSDMETVAFITMLLVVIGTINVFSASFVKAEMDFGSPYFFLIRQGIILVVAFFCCILGIRVDYHKWRNLMPFVLGITFVALITVLIAGVEVNGAKRWLPLPIVQLQPAEVAKLVSVMLISSYLAFRLKQGESVNIFNRQFGFIAAMGILIELEPDAGTMGIVVGVPILLMLTSGLGWRKCAAVLAAGVVAFAGLLYVQPYRMARFMVLYDPWADAQNIGYQTVRSLSAIGSGGFSGMGLGLGVSKYDYLPEAHTDFAFAVWSQETGFLGVALVILLYALFVIYGLRIALSARDLYGEILAAGIVYLIGAQAAINLLMVAGILPVIGVPLPFISYGGTSLVITLAAVGILLNIGYDGVAGQQERMRKKVMETPPTLYLIKNERKGTA